MNLITDKWIPVLRKNSKNTDYISPIEITSANSDNPVMLPDAPRPDFNASIMQFLIGIVQSTLTPANTVEWQNSFLSPPDENTISEAMKKVAKYFELEDPKIRFMQDIDMDTSGEMIEISNLLIDAPGANTIKNNTDHFVKRNTVNHICSSCVALSLYTLQSNAPSGGAGHRTSMRGGGPLSTLIIPNDKTGDFDILWHRVWFNVLDQKQLIKTNCNVSLKNPETIYPWITAIKTSEKKGSETTSEEIHPFQCYWGTPRRIHLNTANRRAGNCDLCGRSSEFNYTGYYTKNYGINYGEGIIHPLSPYYQDKDGMRLPVHPHPGGFGYRHWPSYINSNDGKYARALVLQFLDDRLSALELDHDLQINTRVQILGYDMDNMKARCWYEAQMPYWLLPATSRENIVATSSRMVEAASQVMSNTRQAVRNAWVDRDAKVKGDWSFVETEFWQSTEDFFYKKLQKIISVITAEESRELDLELDQFLEEWLVLIQRQSISLYDRYADQLDLDTGDLDGVPRVIKARASLLNFNRKKPRELLGLADK